MSGCHPLSCKKCEECCTPKLRQAYFGNSTKAMKRLPNDGDNPLYRCSYRIIAQILIHNKLSLL